jgi:exodeoxyribonuclease III
VKIVTWNVNSVRKRETIILDWLAANDPDILLLQETKVVDVSFPKASFEEKGYHLALFGEPGRNGVAILAKHPIADVAIGLPGDADDTQARYIEATIESLRVASVYVPNGTSTDSPNFAYKLAFYDRLRHHAAAHLDAETPLVIGGDFNVAPEPIDVYDPTALDGTICYHPKERAALRALTNQGLYDAFRATNPTRRQFTWWDLRGGSWERDEGLRIDYLLLSPQTTDRLQSADSDPKTRAGKGISDHIPSWCVLG